MPEAILDGEIQLSRREDAVKQLFEFCAINVCQFVARDDFNIRQQIGGVMGRIGDTGFHFSTGNPDLVDQLPVLRDERKLAAQRGTA